jgi:hypothetical protein
MDKRFEVDPEGKRLPIKLDSTSNGEFVPVALSSANRAANCLDLRPFFRPLRSCRAPYRIIRPPEQE